MQTTLKSNWMGSKNSSPVKFRASSNGNVFTRTEKISMIFKQKDAQERKNARQELILKERNKAKAEKENRERVFKGIHTLAKNLDAKVRHGKDSLYIQPRSNGSFGRKIEL